MNRTARLVLTAVLFAAGLQAADPLAPEAIEQRIRQHRTAEAAFTVLAPDGSPLAGQPITIRQTRHKFLFGCNAFVINTADNSELQQAYQRQFAALFNYATLPFYWGAYERQQGSPGEDKLRMMATWCRDNGIRTKGHPLCWHIVQPAWLEGKGTNEVLRLQLDRIKRDVTAFKAWKNAPAGLVRADMTPKPAYDTLLRLVKKDWWTREIKTATDANGKVTFRGFLGDYQIECSYWQGAFTLDFSKSSTTIQVR